MRRYYLLDANGMHIGAAPTLDQAVRMAKTKAAKSGRPVDVVQITAMPTRKRERRHRYFPDGRTEQLRSIEWMAGTGRKRGIHNELR